MYKENSRIAWSFKQVLSLTKKLTKTCKLTAGNKLPAGLNPLFAHYVQPCDFVFMLQKPLGNKCSFAFLHIVQIPIQIPYFSDKFTTQKKSAKKYPHLKILAYYICNKETRLQKGRKNMLKDKFSFIDEATTTAIRNEQDELRMHGATRTLQTLCSSLPSGINAERERFRKMPMQR